MKRILGVGLIGTILVLLLWAFGPSKRGGGVVTADSYMATSLQPPATVAAVISSAPPPGLPPPAATATAATQQTACERLSELCSTSDQKVDTGECERKLGDARKMSGASNVERSESCIAGAKTCAAATGCLSGGVGVGAFGEFLKGLGSALSK